MRILPFEVPLEYELRARILKNVAVYVSPTVIESLDYGWDHESPDGLLQKTDYRYLCPVSLEADEDAHQLRLY